MSSTRHAAQGATNAHPKHQTTGIGIPDLLTPSEVAEVFRVDPKTVTKWAESGKLSCIRTMGGHRRYKTAEIRALLVPAVPPEPPSERPAVNCPVPGLGPLESAIMTLIWGGGQPLTVRHARDRLDYCASSGDAPAYSTVMTVMTILWRKGFLTRVKNLREGNPRAWWYKARVSREDHLAAIIRQALDCAADPAAVLRRALPRDRRQSG